MANTCVATCPSINAWLRSVLFKALLSSFIAKRVAEHDPAAAKRVALHILYCVEYLLSENPKLGAPGRVPGTRELVIPKMPYIVPYRVRGTKIEIARVYHSSRRWPDRL